MTLKKISPLHWTVQMNHRHRASAFLMCFAIIGSHMVNQNYAPLAWFLLAMQFLVYPHLLYWRARFARDSKRAELNNLALDSLLLGTWAAALGFPLWISFIILISTTIHHAIYRGAPGIVTSLTAIALGFLVGGSVTGFHLSPHTDWPATLLCIAGFSIYLLIIANVTYSRNRGLYDARAQLRVSEQALQAANNALLQQNATKTRFLAYAGHDLRQPLQVIHLFLSSLMNSGLNESQDRLAKMIERSTTALADLLNSLLDISKLDAGAIKPNLQALDVDILLAQVIQEFEPQAKANGLRFKLWLPSEATTVISDEQLLSSVLRNLISNAIKYTAKGGVLVAARQGKGIVKIQIWDTGIGISIEEQLHVFEEFYQVDNLQRDRTKGLGLGLAIVKRMSSLLDLKISCRSRLERGTVMEIVLPLATSAPANCAVAVTKKALLDLNGLRFVVVEDTLEVAVALVAWLESKGATVTRHTSAEEALGDEETLEADFFISDYRLPGSLTGIDFLNSVRSLSEKNIHAALLTGDTSTSFIEMATTSGWPILFKPLHVEKLSQILSQLLEPEDYSEVTLHQSWQREFN